MIRRTALLSLLVAAPARAEGPAVGAQAEALFERGRALLADGQWDAACEKFRASVALEPTASSLIKVARCDERAGKLATAWYGYQTAKKLNLPSRPGHRAELTPLLEAAMAALEPRVPKLTIVVAPRPPGLVVRKNGVVLPAAALGEPLPEDPGTVTVEVEAPEHQPRVVHRAIAAGEAGEVRVRLEPAPVARRADTAWQRSAAVPRAQAFTGVALTGVGGGALLSAAALGVSALVRVGESNAFCTPDNACLAEGLLLRREASRYQDVGAGLAIGGALLVGVGLAIALTAPAPAPPRRSP